MVRNAEVFATVKSPAKGSKWRKGKGFSLEEIKQSGKNLNQLKKLNIDIDRFRKSSYQENIDVLKSLKIVEKEIEKRKPFVAKEKKRTPFKPKKEKPKPVKKAKSKPIKTEKKKAEEEGTPLTELAGLGPATAKKFIELGVNNIEELCKENPDEIGLLIKGVSIDRCKDWIEEGKELIK